MPPPAGALALSVGSVALAGSDAALALWAVVPAALGWPDWAFSRMDWSSAANFWEPDPLVSPLVLLLLAAAAPELELDGVVENRSAGLLPPAAEAWRPWKWRPVGFTCAVLLLGVLLIEWLICVLQLGGLPRPTPLLC